MPKRELLDDFEKIILTETRDYGLLISYSPNRLHSIRYEFTDGYFRDGTSAVLSESIEEAVCPDLESFCIKGTSIGRIA